MPIAPTNTRAHLTNRPPYEDADPQESLWDFKGREAKPVASEARQCRMAVIGGRRFRVERFEEAH